MKYKLTYAIAYSLALLLLLSMVFYPSVNFLIDQWMTYDEYSHGPLLVIIALYIIWGSRKVIYSYIGNSSWHGPLIVLMGLVVAVGSIQADILTVANYSIIIVLLGMAISLGGYLLIKEILFPVFLLFMTIPLPYLINVLLTRKLQNISSELGAWIIARFNIPAYLEGNVIELENYTLLVEEACSGLNYLYALVSIGFIWSYFFNAPRMHKAALVLSTIPIAVFMNGVRVGITGVLVNTSGIEVAEGFMHEFEGMLIFLATCLLLLPVVWLLTLLQRKRPAFSEIFDFRASSKVTQSECITRPIPRAALVGLCLIGFASLTNIGNNDLVIQPRMTFSNFPQKLGIWESKTESLPSIIQDVLKADDYYLGDYNSTNGDTINLYMVYYEKQLRQKAIHSPLVCLPGHGWIIKEKESIDMRLDTSKSIALTKMLIDKDGEKLLVYYWIQQQGKTFASDFLARATLVANALFNKRTDGALVRLTAPVQGGDIKRSEELLNSFLKDLAPQIDLYIPN